MNVNIQEPESMADRAEQVAEQVAEKVTEQVTEQIEQRKPWLTRFARFGYMAKGFVYFMIGLLALQAAIGMGGETTGMEGALKAVQRQPFGQILLILTAIGLFGYSMWRLIQAWLDPDHTDSRNPQRLLQRAGYVVSGLSYGYVGLEAVKMVMGFIGSSEGGREYWTAQLLAQPFGHWLVGIVGLTVIGVGLSQLYNGIAARFRKELNLHQMSETEQTWAIRSGRIGYSARGVVYCVIGGFFIWAAIQLNPNEAVGTEEALDKIAQQPYGWVLLALVALGFIAYAIFAFVQARYRKIDIEGAA
jgi:hypothetical protein